MLLGKILPQLVCDFQSPVMRNADRLESTDADRFSRLHAASQEGFDSGHLVGREILGVADHG
jgi:hypothetical protein